MPHCFIALGGNLGAIERTFEKALRRLADAPSCALLATSRFHRTAPVGSNAGPEFLNAAAGLDTELTPLELLELLESIERDLGRVRETHWGPRTLDLDLLFYGSEIINSARLVVPHPAVWYRRFVLDPLVEIAAHFVHPERRAEIRALRDRLLLRPLCVALAGGNPRTREMLTAKFGPAFPAVQFLQWPEPPLEDAERLNVPVIVFWLGDDGPSRHGLDLYDKLPRVSRIDASAAESVADFIRDVLQSALGGTAPPFSQASGGT